MIFQDPLSSLHPFYKIGDQLVEAVQAHRDVSKAQALDRAIEMLGLVGIPEPRRRVDVLPARVLRRHAPARDDRHGAHQRPQAADRRRADDRARRDRPGADPRPHPAPAARARHGDRDDHPRPRRGGRGGRRHRRHVRGADRRVRRQGHDLRRARAPLHLGAAQVDPAPGLAARRGARADPGPPAVADPQAARAAPSTPAARTCARRTSASTRSWRRPPTRASAASTRSRACCPAQTRRALWAALRARRARRTRR